MRLRAIIALPLLIACLALPGRASAVGDPGVAALQVALRGHGVYAGTIDGVVGPQTRAAVMRFQRRRGLLVDGIAGRHTRHALGRLGRPTLGHRALRTGAVGWDVASLQFLLGWHGFPCGTVDGGFGSHTRAAVMRFQRWARLRVDGVAGPATVSRLRGPPPRSPLTFVRPLRAPLGDRFGPRGNSFHPGIDFPAPSGRHVYAGRSGRVLHAGWNNGGYGLLVVLVHTSGVRSMYAHLSSIAVRPGQRVRTGSLLGRVGSTGFATGPHLHFELRLRGAAVNPLPALR